MSPGTAPHPWLKPGVFAGALVPLAVTIWRGARGELGADIVSSVLNQFGYLALTFLAASLLCTPLKIVTGWTRAPAKTPGTSQGCGAALRDT